MDWQLLQRDSSPWSPPPTRPHLTGAPGVRYLWPCGDSQSPPASPRAAGVRTWGGSSLGSLLTLQSRVWGGSEGLSQARGLWSRWRLGGRHADSGWRLGASAPPAGATWMSSQHGSWLVQGKGVGDQGGSFDASSVPSTTSCWPCAAISDSACWGGGGVPSVCAQGRRATWELGHTAPAPRPLWLLSVTAGRLPHAPVFCAG